MATTQEDSYREIQLSGKQLVFWFMAVIVILVTVFLMGLQVGRGVWLARGAPGADSTAAANAAEPPPPPASASAGSSSSPATAGEKLSYAERLGNAEQPKEPLKAEAAPAITETPTPKSEATEPAPAPATPAKSTAVTPAKSTPAPAPAPAPPAKTAAKAETASAPASTEPAGAGFAIQVAALREKAEADTIAKRLSSKGYSAYVVMPEKGKPPVYRVRVGKFTERREADSVAARLQKEEQFKPWIVR